MRFTSLRAQMEARSMLRSTAVKLLLAAILMTGTALAQFGSPGVIYVSVAPSGSCPAGSKINQLTTGTGATYSCQNFTNGVGTWAALAGGGGGGIGGSGTIGTLPIFVTNTTTLGNSSEAEAAGTLNIGTANGLALTGVGATLFSGKIQAGTSVAVPGGLNFSIFLGSDNVFRCQLSSASPCIPPASMGFGVSGTGLNIQTTSVVSSTNGDVTTYDANGNTQDSGTLLSSLAPLTSGITIGGTLVAHGGSTVSFPAPGTIGGTTPGIGDFTTLNCGKSATTSCVFTGFGSTSGTATLTWPAVAGTTSNPIVSSNAINSPSASTGTAPAACGTATGCYAATEGTASNMTATTSQDAFSADATAHAFKMTLNNGSIFTSAMNVPITGDPINCADTSASGSVQVCNTTPSFTPVAGSCVTYTTTTANTGAGLTLNVNSLGAKSVAKWQGSTTLSANDVLANKEVVTCYDGTNWELATIGNAPGGAVSSVNTLTGAVVIEAATSGPMAVSR